MGCIHGGVSVGCVHMGGGLCGVCGVSVLAHGRVRVRPHTLAPLYHAARHAGKRSSPSRLPPPASARRRTTLPMRLSTAAGSQWVRGLGGGRGI